MIGELAALPPEKRAGAVASWDFWWRHLTGVERGKVIKVHCDDLYDHQVAALAGVDRETLGRDDRYMAFKRRISAMSPGVAKYRGRVRRRIDAAGAYNPDQPDG